MPGPQWGDDEASLLRDLATREPKLSYTEIAKHFPKRSRAAIRLKLEALGINRDSRKLWTSDEDRAAVVLDWEDFHRLYPDRTRTVWQRKRRDWRDGLASPEANPTWWPRRMIEVEGDAIVVACAHFPQTNPVMWGRAIAVGQRLGIKRLILAGDAFTADQFSAWLKLGERVEWEWPAELEAARKHFLAAFEWFEEVVILPGNHIGNRIVRISGGHIRLAQVMDMVGLPDEYRERVVTTELDYLDLVSGGERFRICHFADYRKGNDGEVPRLYAAKYRVHVIGGNGHRTGWKQTADKDALYGFEIGTIADPEAMAYTNRTLTTFPVMTKSFASVLDGEVTIYGEGLPLTNWRRLLGETA